MKFYAGIAAAVAFASIASPAQAQYELNVRQIGSSVYVFGGGTLDTSSFSPFGGAISQADVSGVDGELVAGAGAVDIFTGAIGPSSFGNGAPAIASSAFGSGIGVSGGYVIYASSGTAANAYLGSSGATFANSSLASLGLTPGTYTYALGSQAGADSLVINIGAASSAYELDVRQIGSRVFMFGAGTLDVSNLVCLGNFISTTYVDGLDGEVSVGTGGITDYEGITGPASFGTNEFFEADDVVGLPVGIADGHFLFYPSEFASGADLGISGATFNNSSLVSLGLTPGSYAYGVGSGIFQLNIGTFGEDGIPVASVPEPSTWLLLIIGFGILGTMLRGDRVGGVRTVAASRVAESSSGGSLPSQG